MPNVERPISIPPIPLLEGESGLLENCSQSRIQRVDNCAHYCWCWRFWTMVPHRLQTQERDGEAWRGLGLLQANGGA